MVAQHFFIFFYCAGIQGVVLVLSMSKKPNEKRASASIHKEAHKALKQLAVERGFKLNHLIDMAIWAQIESMRISKNGS